MKRTPIVLLSLATLAAALLPQATRADSLTFTLSNPTQSVSSNGGGTLSFSGIITAASTNTGFEYLNGDSYRNSAGTLDDTSFLNTLAFLTPGQSYEGILFTVTYLDGAIAGTFPGSFSILGGADDNTYDTLATANFQANVTAPAAAVTPEPSSLALLGTGALGLFGVVRRRFQR